VLLRDKPLFAEAKGVSVETSFEKQGRPIALYYYDKSYQGHHPENIISFADLFAA